MTQTTNVLFEIGLEEMPARYMNDTEIQLKEKTEQWLSDIKLSFKEINTFITPRRIAIQIKALQDKQDDQEEEVKGPAEKIAKDEAGRSEEHTSELQSRGHLVCRLLLEKKNKKQKNKKQ